MGLAHPNNSSAAADTTAILKICTGKECGSSPTWLAPDHEATAQL